MFPKRYGFIWTILCFITMNAAEQQQGLQAASPLTHLSLSSTLRMGACCLRTERLCVCDMDRLGRNEFIGEVRVALKKLREGENKRYNMGLERIAQVDAWRVCPSVCVSPHAVYFKWVPVDMHISWHVLLFCLPVGLQVSISNAVLWSVIDVHLEALWVITMMSISHFRIKKQTIRRWSRGRWWQRRR